jgi:Domain of unknown function (DUF4032)/Lipopolysaccharide kinase (Kdo/WaaP) family
MRIHTAAPMGHPDFLDLPWAIPLEEWTSERLVEVPRGIARHVVRFVSYDGAIYALKELPRRLAEREYRLLRHLAAEGIPVVEVVGTVTDRSSPTGSTGDPVGELDAVLITQHLEFSLPYRTLFTGRGVPDLRNKLLDALVQLLVRLHLAGFFWGDCSLSNSLFRRDADRLAAYLVDSETGELHPQLTDGQRKLDLSTARENIAGELMDLQAAFGVLPEIDPVETADEICERYGDLWTEVTREETFGPNERYRIDARIRRMNELGFAVEEMELIGEGSAFRLRVQPKVVELGHHHQRLLMLTGLNVQEQQARRLLNDIAGFGAHLEQVEGRRLPEVVVAFRWLTEVFEPAIAAIPPELRGKLEPAQIFHELLEHRWFLSEEAGRDVGMDDTVKSYVQEVLRSAPDERTMLPVPSAPGDEHAL